MAGDTGTYLCLSPAYMDPTHTHHRHKELATRVRTLIADEKIEVKHLKANELEQDHTPKKSGSDCNSQLES